MFSKIILIAAILCLLLSGCTPAPGTESPIPADTTLAIAYPESPAELNIESNLPGMIRAVGYTGSEFLTGTVEVSNSNWLPETDIAGGKVMLSQNGNAPSDTQNFTNLWRLRISDNQPFMLNIRNLQAEGHWNLSGLPLSGLRAECGTARNSFTFDEANPAVIERWELTCGMGAVIAEGLPNSSCREMVVQAGEGDLTLRFNGEELLQDMDISINSGAGRIYIYLPAEVPARIIVSGKQRVVWGEGLQMPESTRNTYETAGYGNPRVKVIEISISGDSGMIYLNSSN